MVQAMASAVRPCVRLLSFRQNPSRLRIGHGQTLFTTNSIPIGRPVVTHINESDPVRCNVATATPAATTTKPQSARPIETRKSQLIRTYTSLLRTTPLMLFFQHSNLTAVEWAAVRRELKKAIETVSQPMGTDASSFHHPSSQMQIQVVRTNMLSVALRIVEFHRPGRSMNSTSKQRSGAGAPVHDLSDIAYKATRVASIPTDSAYAQLEPLLVGPLAALILPAVSPAHLAAALTVLAPVPGTFPAPTRKKSHGYHDPICQNGLAKLLLVGGRIEGKVFDQSGVNRVGGIRGGMDGLRSQLVGVLQGAGLGIATSLESGSRNLWLALEGRRLQLDDNGKED